MSLVVLRAIAEMSRANRLRKKLWRIRCIDDPAAFWPLALNARQVHDSSLNSSG
jgi:hypothetical protein